MGLFCRYPAPPASTMPSYPSYLEQSVGRLQDDVRALQMRVTQLTHALGFAFDEATGTYKKTA